MDAAGLAVEVRSALGTDCWRRLRPSQRRASGGDSNCRRRPKPGCESHSDEIPFGAVVSTQPFSLLSKKGATDSAFASERNSMLAVGRHFVSMLLD